jgi:hypothetical protein
MAKYAQFITYKGKRMLFVNAAGLPEAECLVAFEELKQALIKEGKGVLVLVDMSKTTMTQKITNKAKEATAATTAVGIKDKPNAVVGLTGLQKAVAQLFGRGLHFSNSIEEAREWLVQEDDKGH